VLGEPELGNWAQTEGLRGDSPTKKEGLNRAPEEWRDHHAWVTDRLPLAFVKGGKGSKESC